METMSVLLFGAIDGVWSFLVYVVFGLIAAGIAKAIMPGKDPGGFFVTALIGIVGAYLGHSMRSWLGMDSDGELNFFSFMDWVFTILGALILLFIWKMIAKMLNKES
ncbi:GlsB/YeaQ/YmgE family stress response membrane protein [Moheibacter sediminis]|uniref:Uncharacterized membrane protein YeaQ/YmgE, transglycosylase-associated protein family n=1 Tax=Moheibacter sediminis TaxID=1434700 RepID=A0A1W1Z301_9FLAO|nr:GlsB/YeaQ/YmgE family stress response membrane protein [Moheibacter sediminis]SMC42766.1 Uncharacterized membrane protein YeaQ/YmgE, transglycosylase-associated protein family [Moheibacter sediminis]